MTVLRELVARLGFEVDKSGFMAAIKNIDGVQSALRESARGADKAQQAAAAAQKKSEQAAGSTSGLLKGLGQLAATVGLSTLTHQMIEMASNAQETQNILLQLFGPTGLVQVNEWAATMADTMGRSRFALMEFAGQIGAVVAPVIENKDRVREMSQSFAQLAVDLGSFYNSTDEDAARALRSGLTGEYESLKRYGIVINDATLQEIAHGRGISKKVTAMSVAEKTELRYAAVMKMTTAAQGDAARTGDGFANSSKGLWASLRDLGTMMGQTVLPSIEKVIKFAREGLSAFKQLAEKTFLLKGAMLVLAGAAGVLALNMVSAFILPVAAVLGLIWAIDQLHALFNGGRSDIGDWLDEWGGVGTADSLVQGLTESMTELQDLWDGLPDAEGSWELISGAIDDVGFAVQRVIERLVELTEWLNPLKAAMKLAPTLDKGGALYGSGLLSLFGVRARQDDAEGRTAERALTGRRDRYGRALGTTAGSIGEELELRRKERDDRVRGDSEARAEARAERRRQRDLARQQAAEAGTMSSDPNEDAVGMMSVPGVDPSAVVMGRARTLRRRRGRAVASAVTGSDAAGGGSATPNMSVSTTTTININGADPEAVKQKVVQVLESRDRDTAAGIPWSTRE